jgi:hypothetical protein
MESQGCVRQANALRSDTRSRLVDAAGSGRIASDAPVRNKLNPLLSRITVSGIPVAHLSATIIASHADRPHSEKRSCGISMLKA